MNNQGDSTSPDREYGWNLFLTKPPSFPYDPEHPQGILR